jgi:hypothetical protein
MYISSAFQSTFGWADSLRCPASLLLFMLTPDCRCGGFGPVPIRKEKTHRRGQIHAKTAMDRQTNARDRMKTGATLSNGQKAPMETTALACRIQFYSDKGVKWRRFLPPETFPLGTVGRFPEIPSFVHDPRQHP